MEEAVERLFVEHDIVAEVVCPTQLFPLQSGSALPLLQRAGRVLVVEEGHGFCGFTAELIATFTELDRSLQMRRLYSYPEHIPSSKPLEIRVLPSVERIVEQCLELVR